LLVGVSQAVAQIVPDAGALQRELDLQLQRELSVPFAQPPKPVRKQDLEATGEKITLSGFNYKGNTLFTKDQLDRITAPWLHRPVTFEELKDCIAAVQNFYMEQGRIAQASFPPQDIENSIVLMNILEARMGEVEVTSEAQVTRFSLAEAKSYFEDAGKSNSLIDTKPLERGLLLLNEVAGVSATAAFEQGKEPETSNFKVDLVETPFITGQLSTSNYGSSSTGVAQAVGVLGLNNLTGLGDQLNFNAIQSLGSSYAVGDYGVPIGNNGLKIGVHTSYLQYQTLKDWSDVQTHGTATTIGAHLSYALTRTPLSQNTLKINFDQRSYNNIQESNTISNYQINVLSIGLSGNLFNNIDRSVLTYGVTLSAGHLSINDLTQEGQDITGPGTAGNYAKLSFNLTQKNELSFLSDTTWSNSVYGQLANKNLNSSEQLYLGGPYGVRAYPITQGGGSQGAIFISEINYKINGNWEIGAFTDVGLIQQYVNPYSGWQGLTNAGNTYVLADVGVSSRFTYKQTSIEASLAYRVGNNPLYTSTGQQLNADNSYKTVQGWIRASFYF
jgi:hemolysin activation/secretion protein